MFDSPVFTEICLLSCLKFTFVTQIFNIFVFILLVIGDVSVVLPGIHTGCRGILYHRGQSVG